MIFIKISHEWALLRRQWLECLHPTVTFALGDSWWQALHVAKQKQTRSEVAVCLALVIVRSTPDLNIKHNNKRRQKRLTSRSAGHERIRVRYAN